jgi:hypothetical protein
VKISQNFVAFSEYMNFNGQTFVIMHHFLNPYLNFNQLPAAKKGFINGASQQTFVPSYFDRALEQP